MYSLFCEAKFWTLRNDIQIRDTDFGAFSYHDKKDITDCPYQEGKRLYCERRGATLVLKNKRPLKLKDGLKDLEQYLASHKIVFYKWKDDSILQLILNAGVIVNIGINVHNGDVKKITFDKFLVGKLLSENITDVISTKTHLIISYNENQLTLVNYNKPCTRFNTPEKLMKLDPKIQQVELSGPSGRRIERKLSVNVAGDMILTWWHSSRNEVYPWSPLVKDKDRANVHVYSLLGNKIELLCYYRTEFDQICVNFSQIRNNFIWLVEQKVSKKGDVTVEYSSYEIVKNNFQKFSVTSIPLQTQVCCHSLSPDEEKLIIGCIDGSLILFDEKRGITRIVKTAFIPNLISWHNDGGLIIVANERSQFQFFDIALSCLRIQLLSEDLTPANLIDLASYFKNQPTLISMSWKKKPIASCYMDRYTPNDNFLLLIFEGGPVGILNLIGGGGFLSENQRSGLTPDVIIRQYLLWNQVDKAINLLLSMNWNTNGSACLAGLYHITNFILRYPLTAEKEFQLQTALGSFHVPLRPLNRSTENEFGDQVHDLTRRFFHHLLRHQLYEKAYRLAIDLNDSDLFIDFYYCAKSISDEEMANAARTKYEEIIFRSENSSNCSHSSCSCSESSELTSSDTEISNLPPLPQVSMKKSRISKVPPLPDLNRQIKSRESAFFNRNSVYLLNDTINTIPEERPSELSNSLESVTASTSFNEFCSSQKKTSLNFGSPVSQAAISDFPNLYEASTSFSDALTLKKFRLHDDTAETRQSALNVIEKLYDLPAEPKSSEFFKDTFCNRPVLIDELDNWDIKNNRPIFDQLKMIPTHVEEIKRGSAVENPKQFSLSRFGSFESLKKLSQRSATDEKKSILQRPISEESIHLSQGLRNLPRPAIHPFPSNKNSKLGNWKSLSNFSFSSPHVNKQCLKSAASTPVSKQKVKFSDTVTQIMVPDISNLLMEDDSSVSEFRGRGESSKDSIEDESPNDNVSLCLGSDNYLKLCSKSQDRRRPGDENNGTIKKSFLSVVNRIEHRKKGTMLLPSMYDIPPAEKASARLGTVCSDRYPF